MIRKSGDPSRPGCAWCELPRWVLWLTISSLVMEIIDDVADLVRVLAT